MIYFKSIALALIVLTSASIQVMKRVQKNHRNLVLNMEKNPLLLFGHGLLELLAL